MTLVQEIVKYEKQNLQELTQNFSDTQRFYIYLRIIGFDVGNAARVVLRKPETIRKWRSLNPQFRENEVYILAEADTYKEEASKFIDEIKLGKINFGLLDVAEKVTRWNELPDKEKPQILRAIEIISKTKVRGESKEGYEEMLWRVRRKV